MVVAVNVGAAIGTPKKLYFIFRQSSLILVGLKHKLLLKVKIVAKRRQE